MPVLFISLNFFMFSAFMSLHHIGKGLENYTSASIADNTVIKRTVLKILFPNFCLFAITIFSKLHNIITIATL